METADKAILFTSNSFDVTSALPEDANAGNQFYGRDLAAFLCERLNARGLEADFLDEDWGWLIFGTIAPQAGYEIGVYCFREEDGDGAQLAPDWGLRLSAHRREKRRWFFDKTVPMPVPPPVEAVVLAAIAEIGATPRAWVDGPAG